MDKLRVVEAFSGIGSQTQALKNLGIPHEVVAISEIDKFAIKSYEVIHGDVYNLGDISKVDVEDIPDHDLFTYSFPCQDISIAGNQCGFSEGSNTRSSLLWECARVISHKRPKYLLLENVKNLVGKKFIGDFNKWLDYLESLGYTNYWEVLNSKDFGIPQNRERVFVVSIMNGESFRFPKGYPLKSRLIDVLDVNVDDKFYIKESKISTLLQNEGGLLDLNNRVIGTCHVRNDLSRSTRDIVYNSDSHIGTLTATMYKDPPKIIVQNIDVPVRVRKYDVDKYSLSKLLNSKKENLGLTISDISNGLKLPKTTVEHWFRHPDTSAIPNPDNWYKLKEILDINTDIYDLPITEFIVKDSTFEQHRRVYHPLGISPTLQTSNIPKINAEKLSNDYTIRKLTPIETWRLMGFNDYQFYKAKMVNSDSQLYKQAGNSIVVNVLEEIFKNMFADRIE